MSKLEVKLPSMVRGKVVAKVRGISNAGHKTSRPVVLEPGCTNTIDVEPGHVALRVELPSGEVLTSQTTINGSQVREVKFDDKSSRHEWLDWQQALSPPPMLSQAPDYVVGDSFVDRVRVHRDGQPIEIDLHKETKDRDASYQVHTDSKTFSLTISGYHGERPLIEIVHGDQREITAAPLPWFDHSANPLPMQMILEKSDGGTRADVLVHDPEMSPILAYFASGNRSAARQLSELYLETPAYSALMGKFQNPSAAVAGALVLRQVRRSNERRGYLPEHWLANLSGITGIPDGAILYASHLLLSREYNREHARELLLEARRRGMPIFAQCGRLLLDGLQRLSMTAPDDTELNEAFTWARALVDTQREETIVTWLVCSDELAMIVPRGSTGASSGVGAAHKSPSKGSNVKGNKP